MASSISEEKLLFVCIPYRFENQYLYLLLVPVEWLIIGSNSGVKWRAALKLAHTAYVLRFLVVSTVHWNSQDLLNWSILEIIVDI